MIDQFIARQILIKCQAQGDFHRLPSTTVEQLLDYAEEHKYRKPRNANGSRGRYFHALLVRRAKLPVNASN